MVDLRRHRGVQVLDACESRREFRVDDGVDGDLAGVVEGCLAVGLPAVQVAADSGAIGGKDSHEFMLLAETGAETMTGARLARVAKYLRGGTFMLTYGDGVSDVNIRDLVAFHRSHGKLVTVTGVRPPSRFGEMDIKDNRVIAFNEKPQVSQGLINGGFFVMEPGFLRYLSDDPGCVLEQEPLRRCAQDGQLMIYRHEGFWQPMDTFREYELLNRLWTTGEAPWKTWKG